MHFIIVQSKIRLKIDSVTRWFVTRRLHIGKNMKSRIIEANEQPLYKDANIR